MAVCGGACECGFAVKTQLPIRFVTRPPLPPKTLLRVESLFEQTPGKPQIARWPLQLGVERIVAALTFYGQYFAPSSKQRLAVESKLRLSRGTTGSIIWGLGLWRAQVNLLLNAARSGRPCRCRGGLPIASITSLLPDGTGGSGRGYTGGGEGGGRGGGGGEDGFGFQSTQPQQSGEQPDTEAPSPLPEDVIILEVGGMKCGGCASSVKRILESQPQVTAASVNLATETVLVRVVLPTPDIVGWEKTKGQIAEVLAKNLTSCGFKSTEEKDGQKVNPSLLKTEQAELALLKDKDYGVLCEDSGRSHALRWADVFDMGVSQ